MLAVIGTGALFAQTEIKTVRTGEKLSDVFTAKDIFRYETFLPGKVLFKDGTTAEAPLNYNRIYEQMMFLDAKGDSLAVDNPELVNVIVIGSNNFYFAAEVVLEELNDYGNVKLATHEVLTKKFLVPTAQRRTQSPFRTTSTNTRLTENRCNQSQVKERSFPKKPNCT